MPDFKRVTVMVTRQHTNGRVESMQAEMDPNLHHCDFVRPMVRRKDGHPQRTDDGQFVQGPHAFFSCTGIAKDFYPVRLPAGDEDTLLLPTVDDLVIEYFTRMEKAPRWRDACDAGYFESAWKFAIRQGATLHIADQVMKRVRITWQEADVLRISDLKAASETLVAAARAAWSGLKNPE